MLTPEIIFPADDLRRKRRLHYEAMPATQAFLAEFQKEVKEAKPEYHYIIVINVERDISCYAQEVLIEKGYEVTVFYGAVETTLTVRW